MWRRTRRSRSRACREAGGRLGEAGRRAIHRLDHRAGAALLRRASSLVPRSESVRLDLAMALKDAGELGEAVALLSDAAERAREQGDRVRELRARLELAWPGLADGTARVTDVLELVDRSTRVFEEANDDLGLARAQHVRAIVEVGFRLNCARAAEAATEANLQYERAGAGLRCDVLLAQALTLGPATAADAIELCERIRSEARTSRPTLPYIENYLAVLEALRGETDVARERLKRAASLHEEYGHLVALPTVWGRAAGWVELLAGDATAAESILRGACEQLRRSGNTVWLATQTASLGRALL